MSILNLIENNIDLDENQNFTAIIGINPSKGARSPMLWNYVFEKNDINCRMYCLDVNEKNIENLILKLNKNKFFLGGSVAVPYKETIFEILYNNTNRETRNIGAINCLYRNDSGILSATNTDGEASLLSFQEKFGFVGDKKVLVMGPGGAGKAVISYFLKSMTSSKNLYVSGRSEHSMKFTNDLNCNFLKWNEFENHIAKFDILINCTSIGSSSDLENSPISKKIISQIKDETIVFDIIYDPSPSTLLKNLSNRKIRTIDGKKMNLLQASLAFDYCMKKTVSISNTFEIMKEKFEQLN